MWSEVALSSIGDAVIVTDVEGRVAFMNPVAKTITGWTDEALGKALPEVFRIVNEQTRRAVENPFAKLIREGGVAGMANHSILIRKDGTEVPIDDGGAPIRSEDGVVDGVVLVFRDMTERKRTEQLILDANAYAESIIGTVREPLVILDQNLRVKTASQSFYRDFKVNRRETENQLLYNLGNGQWDIPRLRTLLEEVLPQNNQFDDFEVEHTFEDIGHRTMLLNARRIHQQGNQSELILLAIEDITARKEIEAGLEKTRKELEVIKTSADEALEYAESIINTVREPLIALNQDLRVVSVSRSFYEVFKVNREETVGQLIYDLGNQQWDIPKLRELLEDILPQKAAFDNYEVEHDFSTIGRRIMLLNARQIKRVWGKERIILLAIEDITERKRTENALHGVRMELEAQNNLLQESNEKLRKLSAVKDEFLRIASHDLKNPLAAILLTASLFSLNRADMKMSPEMQEWMGRITAQCRVMLEIIEDFLDFHALEDGQIKLTAEEVDVNALAREVLDRNADYAARKQIATHLDLGPDALVVKADKSRISQVLENYVGNALKFSPPGKHVTIGTRKTQNRVLVEVRDSGPGFTDDDMNKLFVKYAKLSNQPTGGEKSSGLGLAICKKVIEIQGGTTGARNNPDGGATFWFEIPMNS